MGISGEEFDRVIDAVKKKRKAVWIKVITILVFLRDKIRQEPEELRTEIMGLIAKKIEEINLFQSFPMAEFVHEQHNIDPSKAEDFPSEDNLDLEELLREPGNDDSGAKKPSNA